MIEHHEFDVIVVGGGPAGAACSTLLARRGLRVLIIEKAKFPRDKICGDCINPYSWRVFDFLGVARRVLESDHQCISAVRIAGASGSQAILKIPQSPTEPYIAIKRKILDDILLNNAKTSGAVVLESAKLEEIEKTDRWKLCVRSQGEDLVFSSRYLVGADGRNSTVAARLGAEMKSLHLSSSPHRSAVQWHTTYQPCVGNEIQLFKFNTGYCGVVNVDARTANLAMVTDPQTSSLAVSDFSRFAANTLLKNPVFARSFKNFEPIDETRVTYPINPYVRQIGQPDAFLAGDARRTVEPFTGEGIYIALQDGIRLAAHILRLCKKIPEPFRPRTKTTFWANTFYSPLLRNHPATEALIAAASRMPWMSRVLGRAIIAAQ